MPAPSVASLFAQRVVVGVADLGVSNNPSITLSTYALGSCIGVVAYEPRLQVGGLLHFMLPESKISPEKAAAQPAMFADTGLPLLFRSLLGLRAQPANMRFLLAGGASVIEGHDQFRIGERNIRATLDFLAQHRIRPDHRILGGTTNRTLHLDVATGIVKLKAPEGLESYSLAG